MKTLLLIFACLCIGIGCLTVTDSDNWMPFVWVAVGAITLIAVCIHDIREDFKSLQKFK